MIDPRTVLIATPTLDGKVEMGYAGGLMAVASAHMCTNIAMLQSVSHIGLARDLLAHGFLRGDKQWLVFIDSDIQFSAEDFRLLMDYPERRGQQLGPDEEHNPEGTTLTDDGHALIVTAEYSRKVDSLDTVRFGLGFTRIHRSVFEILRAAKDGDGVPLCGDFRHQGEYITQFFPSGPGFEGIWFGEDTAFFHMCRVAGIVPRVEQRTKLQHVGRKVYAYRPVAVREG